MPYDPDRGRFPDEVSPVAHLPRVTGDEVDDERLIANLRAAIARETGAFGLPWYRKPWVQGAAMTCLLLVVSVVSLRVGQRMGSFDRVMAASPEMVAAFSGQDRDFARSENKEEWYLFLEGAVDGVDRIHRGAEAAGLMGDPLYPVSTGPRAETQI
ncbi:MAG TPA: hypothetical protein VEI97_05605 [bacterium]|nr:hypothetical protein [bacterium]